MGIGVLWVPALAGYLFLRQFNGTKFTLLRSTGYQFVLRAAVAGIVLYVIATLISWIGVERLPKIGTWWSQIFPLEYSGTAAISAAIGVILPWFLNLIPFFDKFKAQRRAAFQDGDQLGLLIDQAISQKLLIHLTLSSGKSYIGRAVHGTFGHRDTGDVLVVPVFSGYRDRETRNLVLTTNYAPALKDAVELDRFNVAVPIREIVSVSIFDFELFSQHNTSE